MTFRIKRIYDEPADSDGYRILVDRLWPRGVSKERARLDEWCKEIAPSDELRKEFGHHAERWEDFREQYSRELDERQEELSSLRGKGEKGTVTLLFAAKDEKHNNAVALKEYLESKEGK
jgi:uncharacterized protein YeaO (DUF488 family)